MLLSVDHWSLLLARRHQVQGESEIMDACMTCDCSRIVVCPPIFAASASLGLLPRSGGTSVCVCVGRVRVRECTV